MADAWNMVCELLDELKNCCLLLEGKDSEHFKMHDVVRDIAIKISSDKTYGFYGFANKGLRSWPEIEQVDGCQRIYLMGNSFDSLPEPPPVFPNLRTMILKETQISTIPDRFFQRMETLLVLDLWSQKVASLPSSFSCLVNLKALFLSQSRQENFDVTSLSLIGELKKLEILQLRGFVLGTVPKEFGNLMNLRCLDLLYCKGTIPRNLLSRLSRNLEQLYLTGVFSDWQVEDEGSSSGDAATFAELASLKYLTTLHVDIQNPDVFLQQQDDLNIGQWQALTDFKIAVGILPHSFRLWSHSRSRSKELSITKSTYKWVIDLVTKTEELWLHNWSGMECLIGGAAEEGFTDVGHKLFEVKQLDLRSMPDMRSLCSVGTLPNDILLRKLSALWISECHKLIDVLPTSMLLRTHQLMVSLEIGRCDKVEKVLSLNNIVQEEEEEEEEEEEGLQSAAAAGIVLLPSLKYLSIRRLPELRSVWGRDDDDDGHVIMLPGSLQNLQWLRVFGCKRLKDDHILPPILPIPCLRYLTIEGCHSLTYLLSWRQAKGLPHLQRLYVTNCERMETVIKDEEDVGASATDKEEEESSSVLPSLTELTLNRLPMLRSIFQQGGGEQCSKSVLPSFKSLKKLKLVKSPKLKKLPLSSSSPVNLESLVGESWKWFESFEWGEDKSIKERLRPVFKVWEPGMV